MRVEGLVVLTCTRGPQSVLALELSPSFKIAPTHPYHETQQTLAKTTVSLSRPAYGPLASLQTVHAASLAGTGKHICAADSSSCVSLKSSLLSPSTDKGNFLTASCLGTQKPHGIAFPVCISERLLA